jgi:hypothetical protein
MYLGVGVLLEIGVKVVHHHRDMDARPKQFTENKKN